MGRVLSPAPPPNPSLHPMIHCHFGSSPFFVPERNRAFLFMYLRGTYFATPLFSNSCMEWGCVHPSPTKKGQLMDTATVSSSFVPDPVAAPAKTNSSRCPYLYPNGKRCRLPILDTRSHLCFRHSALSAAVAQPPQNDSEDLSPDLLPELSEFDSAVDINKFLARLLVLVTKGRISPPPRLRPGLHH